MELNHKGLANMAYVLVMAYATYVAFDAELVVACQAKLRFPIILFVFLF